MVTKDDPEAQQKFKAEREQRLLKQQRENEQMNEDIKVLQGKLILLKRYLAGQGALKEANEILNH